MPVESEIRSAAPTRSTRRRRTDSTILRESEKSDHVFGEGGGRAAEGRLPDGREPMDEGVAALSATRAHEKTSHSEANATLTPQEFAAITSHDLRNELSVVSVNAALLQSGAGTRAGDGYLVCVGNIQRAVAHMDHLVSDLLDLARIDVGKLKVNPQVEDVVRVTRESVESFRAVAGTKSVSLRAVLPQAQLPARIDPPRIHQVLSNLLVNAIRFSPEKSEVRVEAHCDNRFITVEVCDSGTGIPAGQLKVIFERYAQLKNSPGRGAGVRGEGLGLGLYIARWIVDAHGGRIWARNNADGGTTFGFCVPRASASTRRSASGASPRTST